MRTKTEKNSKKRGNKDGNVNHAKVQSVTSMHPVKFSLFLSISTIKWKNFRFLDMTFCDGFMFFMELQERTLDPFAYTTWTIYVLYSDLSYFLFSFPYISVFLSCPSSWSFLFLPVSWHHLRCRCRHSWKRQRHYADFLSDVFNSSTASFSCCVDLLPSSSVCIGLARNDGEACLPIRHKIEKVKQHSHLCIGRVIVFP